VLEVFFVETHKTTDVLIPVLPLRDVWFTRTWLFLFFVGREKSIDALETAMKDDKQPLGWGEVRTPRIP
jgi:ATP-dependent Lon protease